MDFKFSEEDEDFRQQVIKFVDEELPWNWREKSIDSAEPSDIPLARQFRQKLADNGWLTMAWPEEYGGQNASHVRQMIFNEEMAYRGVPTGDAGVRMVGPILMMYGTEEQKQQFLPRIAKADIMWCQGYSEPESGSDLASLQTRAVEDGDDFVINGTKIWTSNAHRADWIFMLARTDPDAPKHRGISFLLADMKTQGIKVNPIVNMANEHNFNMVTFDDVRVPKQNLVGEYNRGWYVGAALLDFERSGVEYSATTLRVFEEVVEFCKTHNRNGKPIAEDPIIRHELSQIAVDIEIGKMMSYNIAYLQSQNIVPNKEASMGKAFGTELQQRMAQLGMRILGLYGQLEPDSKYVQLKGKLEKDYLNTVSVTIAAGTSEIQRGIIASRGLGLPRG